MNFKLLTTAAIVAASSLGGYWYYSPYVALHSIQEAAHAKDADAFNQYVDYPRLRESFKGQLSAMMGQKLG